jgi:hypothetical protein
MAGAFSVRTPSQPIERTLMRSRVLPMALAVQPPLSCLGFTWPVSVCPARNGQSDHLPRRDRSGQEDDLLCRKAR